MALKITCIIKANGDHENPYVAITSLGWINPDNNQTGRSYRLDVYNWILDGGYAYVEDLHGNRAALVTAVSPKGTKYVKTESNDTKSDNLLKLIECQ